VAPLLCAAVGFEVSKRQVLKRQVSRRKEKKQVEICLKEKIFLR
jgi:hypothetical protein